MRPSLSTDDEANHGKAHAISVGDFLHRSSIGTNRKHLLLGKFGVRIFDAWHRNGRRIAALRHFVSDIVVIRAQKQMIGIYATRPVTFVQNLLSLGNFPMVGNPTKAMCQLHRLGIVSNAAVAFFQSRSAAVVYTAIRSGLAFVGKVLFERQTARGIIEFSHGDVTASLKVRAVPALDTLGRPLVYAERNFSSTKPQLTGHLS